MSIIEVGFYISSLVSSSAHECTYHPPEKLKTQWVPMHHPPEYFDSNDPIDKVLRRLRTNKDGIYLVPE